VVEPAERMRETGNETGASPMPGCAKAAVGMSVRAAVVKPVRMVVPLLSVK